MQLLVEQTLWAIGDGSTSSSTRSIAIGYNSTASGITSTALGPSANASGFYGTALGYNARAASGGFNSVVAMGNSYASGADSFAAAIANNTSSYGATGTSSIAIGYQAKATGAYSIAMDYQSQATGLASRAIGYQALSSGTNSFALGRNANATGVYSYAIGWSKSATNGKLTYGSGQFSAVGDAQVVNLFFVRIQQMRQQLYLLQTIVRQHQQTKLWLRLIPVLHSMALLLLCKMAHNHTPHGK